MASDPVERPLTTAITNIEDAKAELAEHEKAAAERSLELRRIIATNREILTLSASGIDQEKLAAAERILSIRGSYAKGGQDKASCVSAAIKQLATGKPDGPYHDLWRQYFGTKSYEHWHGQRCDCEYGCGPRHGSIIFAIELTRDARSRAQADLSPDEIEAAIYYLNNLERIQEARQLAKEPA